jgi:hypothetical protein
MNFESYAPIVVFGYNRLDKLITVVESLKINPESKDSDIWFFIDGPKNENDRIIQESIHEYVANIKGFRHQTLITHKQNKGLSKSIEEGVSKVLKLYTSIIVIEDDIKVSKYFLQYLNSGLRLYSKDKKVASIHGYTYPTNDKLPETFFIKGADCWGWGTWRRSWEKYNRDGNELLIKIRKAKDRDKFDFNGHGGYLKMLTNQVRGENDSWAIKWYASMFLSDMYTLYPGKTLVKNIGLDGTGTHKEMLEDTHDFNPNQAINVHKIVVEDSEIGRKAFLRYFRSKNSFQFYKSLKTYLKFRNLIIPW